MTLMPDHNTAYDFSGARALQSLDPIPTGTDVVLCLHIKRPLPGDYFITPSKEGTSMSLVCDFVVKEPEAHRNRHVFEQFMLSGNGSSGHNEAVRIAAQ